MIYVLAVAERNIKSVAGNNMKESFGTIEGNNATTKFDNSKKRLEVAPQIVNKKNLDLSGIAEKLGVDEKDIYNEVKNRIESLVKELHDAISCREENLGIFEIIYNLYLLSRDKNEIEKNNWLINFSDFQTFVQHFCANANSNSKAYIGEYVNMFMNSEFPVYPQAKQTRIMSILPQQLYYLVDNLKKKQLDVYLGDGEWVLMPEPETKLALDAFKFVDKKVIEEIVDILKEGYKKPDLTHSSGSSALEGIAKHKAILSSKEAGDRGEKIKTGEYTSFVNSDLKEGRRLGDVYANKEGVPHFLVGYNFVNWFNEYYVTFGINKNKQENSLIVKDEKIKDFGSEGVLIGSEVPLENIDYVYCQKLYKNEVNKWVEKNCPWAKVISLEAYKILYEYSQVVNEVAISQGKKPLEIWESLIKNNL